MRLNVWVVGCEAITGLRHFGHRLKNLHIIKMFSPIKHHMEDGFVGHSFCICESDEKINVANNGRVKLADVLIIKLLKISLGCGYLTI